MKKQYNSQTSRITAGGLLILLGTLLFCGGSVNIVFYYCIHPSTIVSDQLVSETAYSGILTASNDTLQISLGGFFNRVRLENLYTNDTSIQITLLDWNNTILLSLNHSGPQTWWSDIVVESSWPLARNDSNATLFINRVTNDVTFFVRIITRNYSRVDIMPNTFVTIILPSILGIIGIILIGVGFSRLHRTIQELEEKTI
jgi:hypothetical protein